MCLDGDGVDGVEEAMSETTLNFLGIQARETDIRARCQVLPLPYEATVSYEDGTANGPASILKASAQVELYDRAVGSEGCLRYGIETLPAYSPDGLAGGDYVDGLAAFVEELYDPERLIVGLGGEHTVTVGIVRGTRQALGKSLTLVQIDAHADLRDQYGGDPYSHACISRRLLEDGVEHLVLIGTRSVCPEEMQLIEDDPRIDVFWADRIQADAAGHYLQSLSKLIRGCDVYLTIDVDGLDPSVIPATGTPEPGGLSWWQACSVVRATAEAANIRGMDVTELAPREGLHAADFATAKLIYYSINQVARARGWLAPVCRS
jgi:agmatinase